MGPDDEDDEGMDTSGEIRRDFASTRRTTGSRLLRLLGGLLSHSRRTTNPPDRATPAHRDIHSARGDVGVSKSAGYAVYGDFIKDELEAQDKRKASFEQRGLAVITTSGALVTLLFALAAFSTKAAATFVLPDAAKTWLSVALLLFFLSALAALLTNAPFMYQAVPANKIKDRLLELPPRDADAAAKDIAFTRLKALDSAKQKNAIKGWALAAAMFFEALAVGCVAFAILIIL
jgi:hypothetical protein